MADPEFVQAWAAVHDDTPDGWYVGRPGWEDSYQQWTMHAFDTREKAVEGKRSREWTAVGQSELLVVQEMARCLGELKAGRWPK